MRQILGKTRKKVKSCIILNHWYFNKAKKKLLTDPGLFTYMSNCENHTIYLPTILDPYYFTSSKKWPSQIKLQGVSHPPVSSVYQWIYSEPNITISVYYYCICFLMTGLVWWKEDRRSMKISPPNSSFLTHTNTNTHTPVVPPFHLK